MKKLFYPLTLICLAIIFSIHRLTRLTTSPGLLNTDVEGTMWWLWSRCSSQSSLSGSEFIGFPLGFGFSSFPFWNLWDELRIQLLGLFNCDQTLLILVFSLSPSLFMALNALVAYSLGQMIFKNHHFSFIFALIVAFSSQIILGTRTPLSNIIYFWGLASLYYLVKFLEKKILLFFFLSLLLLIIQTLFNVYIGALFVYLALTTIFSFGALYRVEFKKRIRYAVLCVSSATIGLAPLIRSQIYLYLDADRANAFRPVTSDGSTLPFSYLFLQDRGIYSLLTPDSWAMPSAGWLSTPLLFGVGWGILQHIKFRNSGNPYVIASRWMLASSLFLILFIYRVPGSSIVQNFYFSVFSPLRGVTNFSIAISIQLLISVLLLVQFFQITTKKFLNTQRFAAAFVLVVGLFIYENVPLERSFWSRADITPLINTYKDPKVSPQIGPVLHLPDWLYGPEWGTPQRFIQLAQIGDQQARINGRDYENFKYNCSPIPLPINDENFEVLMNRGVKRIIVHHQLSDPNTLPQVLEFLNGRASSSTRVVHPLSSENLYQSLDFTVFIFDNTRLPSDECLTKFQAR